ncbi:hypothetical protein DIPPA_65129 [Diplonema papillatum]|nr:hypothetical protein DIPPA_65129 [Diplonema papillatum]
MAVSPKEKFLLRRRVQISIAEEDNARKATEEVECNERLSLARCTLDIMTTSSIKDLFLRVRLITLRQSRAAAYDPNVVVNPNARRYGMKRPLPGIVETEGVAVRQARPAEAPSSIPAPKHYRLPLGASEGCPGRAETTEATYIIPMHQSCPEQGICLNSISKGACGLLSECEARQRYQVVQEQTCQWAREISPLQQPALRRHCKVTESAHRNVIRFAENASWNCVLRKEAIAAQALFCQHAIADQIADFCVLLIDEEERERRSIMRESTVQSHDCEEVLCKSLAKAMDAVFPMLIVRQHSARTAIAHRQDECIASFTTLWQALWTLSSRAAAWILVNESERRAAVSLHASSHRLALLAAFRKEIEIITRSLQPSAEIPTQ